MEGASRPTPVTEDELTRFFFTADANGDGKLSLADLRRAAAALSVHPPLTAEDLDAALLVADLDGDGTADMHEFTRAYVAMYPLQSDVGPPGPQRRERSEEDAFDLLAEQKGAPPPPPYPGAAMPPGGPLPPPRAPLAGEAHEVDEFAALDAPAYDLADEPHVAEGPNAR
jgi:hypothetical protein